MTDRRGRTGRPWKRVRAQVLAANSICAICGRPGANSVDHIVPTSLGGDPLDPANLRPAHFSCNSSRGNGTRNPGRRARNFTSRDW